MNRSESTARKSRLYPLRNKDSDAICVGCFLATYAAGAPALGGKRVPATLIILRLLEADSCHGVLVRAAEAAQFGHHQLIYLNLRKTKNLFGWPVGTKARM